MKNNKKEGKKAKKKAQKLINQGGKKTEGKKVEKSRADRERKKRHPPPGNWLEVNRRGRDNYRCIVGFVGAAV